MKKGIKDFKLPEINDKFLNIAKAIDAIFDHINELDDEVESLKSTIEGLHYQYILESE